MTVELHKNSQGEEEKETEQEQDMKSIDAKADEIKKKKKNNSKKRRLLKEASEAGRIGICYLSRIPPHMDPFNLRQILSQFGDIQRIYLTPESNISLSYILIPTLGYEYQIPLFTVADLWDFHCRFYPSAAQASRSISGSRVFRRVCNVCLYESP